MCTASYTTKIIYQHQTSIVLDNQASDPRHLSTGPIMFQQQALTVCEHPQTIHSDHKFETKNAHLAPVMRRHALYLHRASTACALLEVTEAPTHFLGPPVLMVSTIACHILYTAALSSWPIVPRCLRWLGPQLIKVGPLTHISLHSNTRWCMSLHHGLTGECDKQLVHMLFHSGSRHSSKPAWDCVYWALNHGAIQ